MYILPEIVVYQDSVFSGAEWRFNFAPGWGWSYVGDNWNDQISSVVIIAGTWQFFENAGFSGASTIVGFPATINSWKTRSSTCRMTRSRRF